MNVKMYVWKSRAVLALVKYKPKNEAETKTVAHLINRIPKIRSMDLPNFVAWLYRLQSDEDLSDDLKKLLAESVMPPEDMLEDN